MPATYTPSAANALVHAFPGQPADDPLIYTTAKNKRIDAKYTLVPPQNEILALWQAALALPTDQKVYACIAGLNLGDPVYLSAADTVTLALADTAAHAQVVGFVAYKPTTTSCMLRVFALKTGLTGLTVGARVYLTDAGAVSATPGTVRRALGVAINTTDAILFAAPLALSQMLDIDLTGLTDGFTLAWNAAGSKWVAAANATTDENVKADPSDPTAGKLSAKMDGSTLEVDTSAHVARIKDGGVTYAKIQNVSATDKLLGRATAGAGSVEEIACTAAGRALLDDTDAAAQRSTLGAAAAPVIATKTAADNVLDADSGKVFNNSGATAEVELTMPAASAGAGPFSFYCSDTDGLKIRAGAGDAIRIGAGVSSAAGYALSTAVGSSLTLIALDADTWVALSSVGTWSLA